MNIKVVIVWAFVIVIFAGIGIFGYVNQDLLLIQDTEPYVPMAEENAVVKACNYIFTDGQSNYRFSITNDQIDKITITYTAAQENLDNYAAASNINQVVTNNQINGVSTVLYGGTSDFVLYLNVNVTNFDKATLYNALSDDLSKLLMHVDNISDYEEYKTLISQSGNVYTCE